MQEIHGKREFLLFDLFLLVKYFSFVIMQPLEIYVDDETKLTLHGLQQHYVKLQEVEKNRKLNELLDQLEFNQVILIYRCVVCRLINDVF